MKTIKTIYQAVDGYKTYIVAIIIAILNLAVAAGWITADAIDTINAVLVALGLGTLRAGVKK